MQSSIDIVGPAIPAFVTPWAKGHGAVNAQSIAA